MSASAPITAQIAVMMATTVNALPASRETRGRFIGCRRHVVTPNESQYAVGNGRGKADCALGVGAALDNLWKDS